MIPAAESQNQPQDKVHDHQDNVSTREETQKKERKNYEMQSED